MLKVSDIQTIAIFLHVPTYIHARLHIRLFCGFGFNGGFFLGGGGGGVMLK